MSSRQQPYTVVRLDADDATISRDVIAATSADEATTIAERRDAGLQTVARYVSTPATLAEMLAALQAEAAEHSGCYAWIDYPGYVRAVDAAGRLILIGEPDEPHGPDATWRADVWPTPERWEAGEQPAAVDTLNAPDVRIMFTHALQIAARVPVTNGR